MSIARPPDLIHSATVAVVVSPKCAAPSPITGISTPCGPPLRLRPLPNDIFSAEDDLSDYRSDGLRRAEGGATPAADVGAGLAGAALRPQRHIIHNHVLLSAN